MHPVALIAVIKGNETSKMLAPRVKPISNHDNQQRHNGSNKQ